MWFKRLFKWLTSIIQQINIQCITNNRKHMTAVIRDISTIVKPFSFAISKWSIFSRKKIRNSDFKDSRCSLKSKSKEPNSIVEQNLISSSEDDKGKTWMKIYSQRKKRETKMLDEKLMIKYHVGSLKSFFFSNPKIPIFGRDNFFGKITWKIR